MDKTLNASDFSHTRKNDSQWQFLGELVLPVGADPDDTIRAWLTELFDPLALHGGFLNRILVSAQEAAARAFQGEAAMKCDHVHLVIFGPRDPGPKLGTWGFFRVEKIENTADASSTAAHSIEFYLYMEGRL
jgi:hypothetical protein